MRAIAYCKEKGGVLLIAKLGRLTRNVAFIFTLRDSGVEFVCADRPQANTFTIGVMATLAQYEREIIEERTRNALAEKKRAGFRLGRPENLTRQAVEKGNRFASKTPAPMRTIDELLHWLSLYGRRGRPGTRLPMS